MTSVGLGSGRSKERSLFHRAALLRLADQDVARLLTLRLDGRAIAFALALQLSGRRTA
jgi:hypothetical protein